MSTSTRSTPPSRCSRIPTPAGQAGHRRRHRVRAGWSPAPSYEARAFGVRSAMPGSGRGACARRASSSRRTSRHTASHSNRFREVLLCSRPAGGARSRSTRRSSTSAAPRAVRLAAPRSPSESAATSSATSVSRARSGSPPRSSWRSSPPSDASPTACCWCRPGTSGRSFTRCRRRACGG